MLELRGGYIKNRFGKLCRQDIKRPDVLAFMRSYEAEGKLETRDRVRSICEQICEYADVEGDGYNRFRNLKGQIGAQKGSTYFARMQYGRLVDAALQSMSEKYVAEIFEALRDVAVASRANKPIGDKMIMNAAFLVARDKEQAFDQRVKQIGAKYDKLTFKYTGPWPPYNFVNIRLKLERAKEGK